MKMDVIEGGKDFRAIARRHVLGNFLHARPVVYMSVGVDDLHSVIPLIQFA
jgi:hypothetical protein